MKMSLIGSGTSEGRRRADVRDVRSYREVSVKNFNTENQKKVQLIFYPLLLYFIFIIYYYT